MVSISEMILLIVFGAVKVLLFLVPAVSFPADFITSYASLFVMLASVGYFLPLNSIFGAVVVLISLYMFELIIKVCSYLFVKIPFLNIR